MNLAVAYDILGLEEKATIEDVSVSFRRLLKRYHPDRNIDRSEWSHAMTVRLNEAYEVAITHLQNTAGSVNGKVAHEEPAPTVDRWQDTEEEFGFSIALQTRMANLFDLLLDQVFAYYTYGLDNLYLRAEGTRRYRYRTTVRHLKSLIGEVRACLDWPGSSRQRMQVDAVVRFGTGFYENMLIKTRNHTVFFGDEQKAYQLYRTGAESLDQAIKVALFGKQFNGHGGYASPRSTCEQNLVLLFAQYPKSSFVAEALIKMYLLQGFDALCEHVLQ